MSASASSGPVVLITGAAGALGKAATAYFAAAGARLALLDVIAIEGPHYARTCDLTDAAACAAAGANVMVAGSSTFRAPDMAAAICAIREA